MQMLDTAVNNVRVTLLGVKLCTTNLSAESFRGKLSHRITQKKEGLLAKRDFTTGSQMKKIFKEKQQKKS
jgi:hypothetical protein